MDDERKFELEKKVEQSIKLLQSIKADEIELSYSGGKDSDVILELANLAGIPFRAIYKKTTIDPAGTIKHCVENGVEIMDPKQTFFELIEQHGYPTMRCRFCCDYLKEYKVLDHSIQGIRRCESVKRMKNYKEPVICRVYRKKSSRVSIALPILEWLDKDVEDFVNMQNIKCHPLYYPNGVFDVTKRLGCIGCPLKSDKGLSDFKQHPRMVVTWTNAAQKWWDKPRVKDISSKMKFANVYELFAHNVFFDSYQSFDIARSGLFGRVDFKERLEAFFGIKF